MTEALKLKPYYDIKDVQLFLLTDLSHLDLHELSVEMRKYMRNVYKSVHTADGYSLLVSFRIPTDPVYVVVNQSIKVGTIGYVIQVRSEFDGNMDGFIEIDDYTEFELAFEAINAGNDEMSKLRTLYCALWKQVPDNIIPERFRRCVFAGKPMMVLSDFNGVFKASVAQKFFEDANAEFEIIHKRVMEEIRLNEEKLRKAKQLWTEKSVIADNSHSFYCTFNHSVCDIRLPSSDRLKIELPEDVGFSALFSLSTAERIASECTHSSRPSAVLVNFVRLIQEACVISPAGLPCKITYTAGSSLDSKGVVATVNYIRDVPVINGYAVKSKRLKYILDKKLFVGCEDSDIVTYDRLSGIKSKILELNGIELTVRGSGFILPIKMSLMPTNLNVVMVSLAGLPFKPVKYESIRKYFSTGLQVKLYWNAAYFFSFCDILQYDVSEILAAIKKLWIVDNL